MSSQAISSLVRGVSRSDAEPFSKLCREQGAGVRASFWCLGKTSSSEHPYITHLELHPVRLCPFCFQFETLLLACLVGRAGGVWGSVNFPFTVESREQQTRDHFICLLLSFSWFWSFTLNRMVDREKCTKERMRKRGGRGGGGVKRNKIYIIFQFSLTEGKSSLVFLNPH